MQASTRDRLLREGMRLFADLRSRVYDPGDAETTDLDPAATELHDQLA